MMLPAASERASGPLLTAKSDSMGSWDSVARSLPMMGSVAAPNDVTISAPSTLHLFSDGGGGVRLPSISVRSIRSCRYTSRRTPARSCVANYSILPHVAAARDAWRKPSVSWLQLLWTYSLRHTQGIDSLTFEQLSERVGSTECFITCAGSAKT
jgi:hypothetical protein